MRKLSAAWIDSEGVINVKLRVGEGRDRLKQEVSSDIGLVCYKGLFTSNHELRSKNVP